MCTSSHLRMQNGIFCCCEPAGLCGFVRMQRTENPPWPKSKALTQTSLVWSENPSDLSLRGSEHVRALILCKVGCLLLICTFFFDIFWVFLSPLIFKKSVMIEALCSATASSAIGSVLRVAGCHWWRHRSISAGASEDNRETMGNLQVMATFTFFFPPCKTCIHIYIIIHVYIYIYSYNLHQFLDQGLWC